MERSPSTAYDASSPSFMTQPDSLSAGVAPLRLLFVCSGNTCRSPLAEALARNLAPASNLGDVEVRSAGTSALPGSPASGGARRAAHRHGLSLEGHSATRLSPELVQWADKVLAMGPSQLEAVGALGGGEKAVLLGAFAEGVRPGGGAEDLAVPDPYGGDDEVYEETLEVLKHYVTLAMRRLAGESR